MKCRERENNVEVLEEKKDERVLLNFYERDVDRFESRETYVCRGRVGIKEEREI